MDLQWLPLLLILILNSPLLLLSNPLFYQTCNTTYNCGTITGIRYPFIGNRDPQYCGYPGFELTCNSNNFTTIHIQKMQYRIIQINQHAQTMRIAREDVMESICPTDLVNTTIDSDIFRYTNDYINLTFRYGCLSSTPMGNGFVACGGVYVLPGSVGRGSCNDSVVVPVTRLGFNGSGDGVGLDRVMRSGLDVGWVVGGNSCRDCTGSGGRCGYDYSRNQTACFCSGPPYVADTCPVNINGAPRLSGT